MIGVFDATYAGYSIGVLGLCGLALLGTTGRLPSWSVIAARTVAAAGVLAVGARWVTAGHMPMFGTFENTLTASACLMATAVWTSWRRRTLGAWAWAVPWALALLLYGTQFRREAVPLTISERSLWLDAHVVFAWLAFCSLLLASSLAVPRILGRSVWGLDADSADERIAGALNVGFLSLTAMILVGAWYLYVLFAEFWRWDIVGTLSLAAWLAYGMVIHARLFYRLGGRGLAAAILAVLPLLILSLWVWSVFPGTYHHFEIVVLKPY